MGHFKYLIIGILSFALSHYEAEAHRPESGTLVKIDYNNKQSGISVPQNGKHKRNANVADFYPQFQYHNIPRNYDYHHIDSYHQQQQNNFPHIDQHNHNGFLIHPQSFVEHKSPEYSIPNYDYHHINSYDQSHKSIFPHTDHYNHDGFVHHPPSFPEHGHQHEHHKFLHHEKENIATLEKKIPIIEDHLEGNTSELQENATEQVSVNSENMQDISLIKTNVSSNQSVIEVEQNAENNSTVQEDEGHHNFHHHNIPHDHHRDSHDHHHPIDFSEHGLKQGHEHKHGYEHGHGHVHGDKHDHHNFHDQKAVETIFEAKQKDEKQIPIIEDNLEDNTSELQQNATEQVSENSENMQNISLVKTDESSNQSVIDVEQKAENNSTVHEGDGHHALHHHNIPCHHDRDSHDDHPIHFSEHGHDHGHNHGYGHLENWHEHGHGHADGDKQNHHKFHVQKAVETIFETKQNDAKQIPIIEDNLEGNTSELQQNATEQVSVNSESMQNISLIKTDESSNQSVIEVEQNAENNSTVQEDEGHHNFHHHNIPFDHHRDSYDHDHIHFSEHGHQHKHWHDQNTKMRKEPTLSEVAILY